jgi:hypothetical protein
MTNLAYNRIDQFPMSEMRGEGTMYFRYGQLLYSTRRRTWYFDSKTWSWKLKK